MAKYECEVIGEFEDFLKYIENGIIQGSLTATLEDSSDFYNNGVKVAVRVFERYSMFGDNRLSMNVTMVNKDNKTLVSVITSGGSKGVFKLFPLGEETFLEKFIDLIKNFRD